MNLIPLIVDSMLVNQAGALWAALKRSAAA
jgi:hypothetical protein